MSPTANAFRDVSTSSWMAALTLSVTLLWYLIRSRSRLPLPPGPRKLPLIGNLRDMPSSFQWEKYMEWSKEHDSDIIHLDTLGTSIIVLSSAEAANELLEKRSTIYSGRARMPMINELMGWEFGLGGLPYDKNWRTQRRLFHHTFNIEAVRRFHPKQRTAAHELLRRILRDPDGVSSHLRHMTGEAIMSIAYGIQVLPTSDPYIELVEKAMHTFSLAAVRGRYLVDYIPALKYVPDWFPGAGFKRQAKEWKKLTQAAVETPFAEAKRNIATGTATPSFTSYGMQIVEESEDKAYMEMAVKNSAASMYTAGADTTLVALINFILVMLANPDAQKMAQVEIDSVVGRDRLPDFDDEDSLPYVSALVKEVLRWKNVTPTAIPHLLEIEDFYKGYRLPAKSVVIANAWAILHDETMYPDPYSFKPERFLLDGKPNPEVKSPDAAFGFGRRICPGRHMAMSSMWITIASILSTFNITKAVGDDGKEIEPSYECFSGLIAMPLPFKCSIKPRSRETEILIRATVDC
ncbi:cytochrome P450 [Mycena rebaudengoi]|nr:cytochrome P450 [Mycena rebaudengoi]